MRTTGTTHMSPSISPSQCRACGINVSQSDAPMRSVVDGDLVDFCSNACRRIFMGDEVITISKPDHRYAMAERALEEAFDRANFPPYGKCQCQR